MRTDCASATVLVVLGLVWTNRSPQLSAREGAAHATGRAHAVHGSVAARGWPQQPAVGARTPRPRAPLKVADQRDNALMESRVSIQ